MDVYDFDRLDEDRLAAAGAFEPDDLTSLLDADRAAYVPDEPTADELYAEDVAEEYRREALADRWAS